MGAPWRVRAKLRAIFLALLPIACGLDAAALRPWAQEAGTSCVDASGLARSVVSLAWYFDRARPAATPGREVIGERATAWFYASPRILVTAAHFAKELPAREWLDMELRQASREGEPDAMHRVQLRVVARGGSSERQRNGAGSGAGLAEDVAILELRDTFPTAHVLEVEPDMPAQGAQVLVLSYPGGRLQAARGILRKSDDPAGKLAGLALLEVQGSNRLLLNAGASGAPVLDCRQGRVVAVLNGLLTGPSLPFLPPDHGVLPTPWGSPTNTAVPASILTAMRNLTL